MLYVYPYHKIDALMTPFEYLNHSPTTSRNNFSDWNHCCLMFVFVCVSVGFFYFPHLDLNDYDYYSFC